MMNLLEALNQSIAEFNGETVEVVRERMERMRPIHDPKVEAEDAANLGEAQAEALAIWREDSTSQYA
jgi:hypothetical protein